MSDRSQVSIRIVTADEEGRRLDNFLTTVLRGVPKALVYRFIRSGEVRVNGRRAKAGQRLLPDDKVRIPPYTAPDTAAPQIGRGIRQAVESAVMFEDEHLLVLNKPAGLAVHGGTGLAFGLIDVVRAVRPDCTSLELVHRLDRETSGCLLFAKDGITLRNLHRQLREGGMRKAYVTLLAGRLPSGRIPCQLPLAMAPDGNGERHAVVSADGAAARTEFTARAWYAEWTLTDVELETGRTHQIRAHAAALGHPVAGDTRYGEEAANHKLRDVGFKRMFLHAAVLEFDHAGPRRMEAQLPSEDRKSVV